MTTGNQEFVDRLRKSVAAVKAQQAAARASSQELGEESEEPGTPTNLDRETTAGLTGAPGLGSELTGR